MLYKLILLLALCGCAFADTCSSFSPQWKSVNGRIEYNGKEFRVKGLNWWGFEDPGAQVLTGLDQNSFQSYIDFMVANKFNFLRIPISVDWVIHPNRVVPSWAVSAEPSFQGKTGFQILDQVFDTAQQHGIAIVLDFHWFITYDENQLGLWYAQGPCVTDVDGDCPDFTEQVVMSAWDTIIARYKAYSNFMGVDFFNEAWDTTWGSGNQSTDWDSYVVRQVSNITAAHPDYKGLFFVEGLADAPSPPGCNLQQTSGHWWGGNLEFLRCGPLNVSDQTRLVYFPHTYGPSLYEHDYFLDPSFPNNMPTIWNAHFGFLRQSTDQAVIIGEWGGLYNGSTKVFQDAFASYMNTKGIGNVYWAMIGRPGEVNTVDGLIQVANNSITINTGKLAMLSVAQPTPTILDFCSASISTTNMSSSSSGTSMVRPDIQLLAFGALALLCYFLVE